MDHGGCGILVHVEDGRIIKIEGDPESPLNMGTLCAKGIAQIEKINHPDRLLYPMKRKGNRGEGKWERISWDEALSLLTEKIEKIIRTEGSQSIAFAQGTPKGLELFLLLRLANLLQVPNISTPGNVCHMPRETASNLTCGFFPIPDYDHFPACVVLWGSNLLQTNEEGIIGSQLLRVLKNGAQLIVIDPRKTGLASRSRLWLRLRPGTDLALALGIIKVLIDERLYDQEFVEDWTQGFSELKEHLQQYPLERIEEITWIPKDRIIQAAHIIGNSKPTCFQWGNAIEHTINSFQCARAILILMAITGNLEVPGGNVNRPGPSILRPGELVLSKKFLERKEKILTPEFRLATLMGFVPSQKLIKAILTEQPYPIRMMYIQGGNPLLSYAHAQETYEALKKLDFLAVSEIFLTPTAQLSDLLLPAATNFEFDDIGHYGLPHGFILARPKIVEPKGECWADSKIINEWGKRLGYSEFFWEDIRDCLDTILKPAGLTYEDFKSIGILKGRWEYQSYKEKGFRTTSRKVEIYCQQLKEWGFSPLPAYQESLESPILFSEENSSYPFLFTSSKDPFFFHSAYRNIPSLRKHSQDPFVLLHPQTASRLGIKDGDWIVIETKRGAIKQKAKMDSEIHPRVVVLSFGWWFPERKDLQLSGWKESNLNILTSNDPPYDPLLGTTNLRAVPCRIYK